jgi:hypothetical protein
MQKTILSHLASTYQLLQCAFPQGVMAQEYFPLLFLLYEQMSDRSLAQVIAEFTGKAYPVVLNDIYRIGSEAPPSDIKAVLPSLERKLMRCNYEQWLKEFA